MLYYIPIFLLSDCALTGWVVNVQPAVIQWVCSGRSILLLMSGNLFSIFPYACFYNIEEIFFSHPSRFGGQIGEMILRIKGGGLCFFFPLKPFFFRFLFVIFHIHK